MAISKEPNKSALSSVDPVWQAILQEAQKVESDDPVLSNFIYSNILNQDSLESAVGNRISERLHSRSISSDIIKNAFAEMANADNDWKEAVRRDLAAVYDRDPACSRFVEPILYFKGFHAIQTHRLAHWNLKQGRKDFALYLQSRSSEVFQTDINPGAVFGHGIFLDHATGVVIGETAVIGNDVSILHGVTLGGTGKDSDDRHPKIGNCVLLGAGAKVLGNIKVGDCSRIAAGSLVIKPVDRNVTVAGVPGRVVGIAGCSEPARSMDQILEEDK